MKRVAIIAVSRWASFGLAMTIAGAVAAGAIAPPGPATPVAAPTYGAGDVCRAVSRPGAAAKSLRCLAYPRRISWHARSCRWVEERSVRGPRDFEICRDRDGLWRASGRG